MKAPKPLARVLLGKVLTWYVLLAIAVIGTHLYFEYRSIRQEIVATLKSLAETCTPGASAAIWNYQQDFLNSLAQGIGQHEFVTTVDITDLNGRIGSHYRAVDNESAAPDLSVKKRLYHRFENGHQEELGLLELSSSETKVWTRLKKTALAVGLSIMAQLLFLGGILVVSARLLVVEPLTRFSRQVNQWVTENRAQRIDVSPIEALEIMTLQQGFNQLLQRIAESHTAIATANTYLEQRVAERTQALDERNRALVQEREFTLALVRSVPGFVCVLDGMGKMLLSNQAAETLMNAQDTGPNQQQWLTLSALVAGAHPLQELLYAVHTAGHASRQVRFLNQTGQANTYQFEAIRIGEGLNTRIIVMGLDITQQHENSLRLQHQAYHDRLTGLPNRGLLLERLERAITAASRKETSLALAFIDLDSFKPINDSMGHEAGDVVLRKIAMRLRQCVRESDTVARHGGDEFILLLLDHHPRGLQRIATDVLKAVARPIIWQNSTLQVSASIGFAVYPRDGENPQELIDAADTSMYRAKQAGRNQADFGEGLPD